MITKSLIAAAAIASTMAVALPASQAQAGDVNIKIGVGFGGGFHGHYGYGPSHISCWKGAKIVDWSGFNNVKAIDCHLPGYKYTARKNGHKFVVRVNGYGNFTNVDMIF